MAKAVKAGYLWVNTYGGIIPETPYGSFKQSGIGADSATVRLFVTGRLAGKIMIAMVQRGLYAILHRKVLDSLLVFLF